MSAANSRGSPFIAVFGKEMDVFPALLFMISADGNTAETMSATREA